MDNMYFRDLLISVAGLIFAEDYKTAKEICDKEIDRIDTELQKKIDEPRKDTSI